MIPPVLSKLKFWPNKFNEFKKKISKINLFIIVFFFSLNSVEVYYFTRTRPTIVKMLNISDRGKKVSL